MCGIVGFLSKSNGTIGDLNTIVQSMASAITYRGPDDGGTWSDVNIAIALGHRRLAILDLSSAGHQPMHSASDRYVLTATSTCQRNTRIKSLCWCFISQGFPRALV